MLRKCVCLFAQDCLFLFWSGQTFYFCSKLSEVLDELAKLLLLSDFLNKLFGILEQMYLFIALCNDKVGIFPC